MNFLSKGIRLMWNAPDKAKAQRCLVSFVVVAVSVLCCVLCADAATGCRGFIQRRDYKRAARCFLRLFAQTKVAAHTEPQRIACGRRLRNAALAFRLAAKGAKEAGPRSFLYLRAVQTLQLYLKGRWYEDKYRKRRTALLLAKWRAKIQYTPLTLVIRGKGHRYLLTGYHFRETFQKTWSRLVRPGRYRVEVLRPTKGAQAPRVFVVKPKEAKVLTLSALAVSRSAILRPPVRPPVRPKVSAARRAPLIAKGRPSVLMPIAWTTAALAGAALVVGTSMLVAAYSFEGDKNRLYDIHKAQPYAASTTPDVTEKIKSLDEQAHTFAPAGVGLLIAAGGVAAVAALLFVLSPPRAASSVLVPTKKGAKAASRTSVNLVTQTF